jgi:hypothetical protein
MNQQDIDEYNKESALLEERNKKYILKYIHRKTFYVVCFVVLIVNAYKVMNVLSWRQIGQLFVTQDGWVAITYLVFEMLYNGALFGLIVSLVIWLKKKMFKPKQ